jgi:predicted dehydrogenase
MAKPRKTRVGFIGSGGIAQAKHVPGHKGVLNVEIVACCDIDERRAKAFAERNQIPAQHVFTDYHKMLEMDALDAVSVCTPNNLHAGPTVAALNAGKHVLCEKPLAGNAKDGAKMVAAAKKSGKVLQIGLQSRFNAHWYTLKRRVEQGLLGDIYYGRTMAVRRRGIPASPTFIKKEISGGGCLIDIGVHSFDLLLYVIGYPDPMEAFGATWRKFGDNPDIFTAGWGAWNPALFDAEDFAVGQVKFKGGLTVTVETAWASHTGNIGADFVIGDKGGASLTHPVRIYADHPKATGFQDYELKPLKRTPEEFPSFHDAIRKGTPCYAPGEEVLKLAKIFDAIYESAEKGHSVKIA